MSRRLRPLLLLAALGLLATLPSCWGLIPGQPTFCIAFCTKCGNCHAEDMSFEEDDCYYDEYGYDGASYGDFDMDDCMEGCLEGALPGHPMPPSWQGWSCEAFDDFL